MTALSSLRLPISPFLLPKHGLYHLLSRTSSSLFPSPKPRFWTVQCSSSLASTSDSTSLPTDTSEEGLKWESFRKKKVVMRIGYVGTDYRGKNDYAFLPLLSRSHSSAVLCYCPNYLLFQNIRFISHSLSLQGFKCNATSMNYRVSAILTNWKSNWNMTSFKGVNYQADYLLTKKRESCPVVPYLSFIFLNQCSIRIIYDALPLQNGQIWNIDYILTAKITLVISKDVFAFCFLGLLLVLGSNFAYTYSTCELRIKKKSQL